MFMEKQIFKKFNSYVKLESSIRLQNSTYSDAIVIKIHYASALQMVGKSRLTISAQVDFLKRSVHSKSKSINLFLAQLESVILDWLILFHSCFLSFVKDRFNDGAEQAVETTLEPEKPSTIIEESPPKRQQDSRIWIAVGVIVTLLIAITIKYMQIEKRADESLAQQLVRAKKTLLEQEMYIMELWSKLKAQMEERHHQSWDGAPHDKIF